MVVSIKLSPDYVFVYVILHQALNQNKIRLILDYIRYKRSTLACQSEASAKDGWGGGISTHEYFSAEKFREPSSPPSQLRPCELPLATLTPILGPQHYKLT